MVLLDAHIPTYYKEEVARIKKKRPTILVCHYGSARRTHDRASDSTFKALMAFRDKYPDVSIDLHTLAATYNNNHSDEWCITTFLDHCTYFIRQDHDQILERNHIIRLYEYMETHPDIWMAAPRCNKRSGEPLSYNDDGHWIPLWLEQLYVDGIRKTPFAAYNAAMFRMDGFKEFGPPYFVDSSVNGQRVDGINYMNRKSHAAGLQKAILYNVIVGHIREEENWPTSDNELMVTIARRKVYR